jgi:hypothetical protein
MKRRELVGGTWLFAGTSAGCLTGSRSEPNPEIGLHETENHRRHGSYVFTIEIVDTDYSDDEEVVVFHETQ